MRTYFVDVTYSICTPESAALGAYAETGLEREGELWTWREIVEYCRDNGIYTSSCSEAFAGYQYAWISSNFEITDSATGEKRELSVHIEGMEPRNRARLLAAITAYPTTNRPLQGAGASSMSTDHTKEDLEIITALRTHGTATDARNDNRAMMGPRPTNARVIWDASRQPATANEFANIFVTR